MRKCVKVYLHNKPFMGEQIVLIPFFDMLRRLYPGHDIVAASPGRSATLLQELGYIDHLYEYHPKKFISGFLPVLLRVFRHPAAAAFQLRRNSEKTTLLAFLSARAKTAGFRKPVSNLLLNKTYRYTKKQYIALNFLQLLGCDLEMFRTHYKRKPEGHFVITPVGSQSYKRYPIKMYVALAARLREHHPVHFVIGADLVDDIAILNRESIKAGFTVHVNMNITDMRRLIRGANAVIGNDSGPNHLAHIYGIPRVCLFAMDAYLGEWYSPGPKAVALVSANNRKDDIHTIPVARVYDTVMDVKD